MDNTFHISKVHLSGYRTIKDVNVDFVPGLNIIIGNNGVGKTNFLEFLTANLNFSFKGIYNFSSHFKINYGNGKIEEIGISKSLPENSVNAITAPKFDFSIIDGDNKKTSFSSIGEFNSYHLYEDRYYVADFIEHGVHLGNIPLLSFPLSISSVSGVGGRPFYSVFEYLDNDIYNYPYYIKSFLVDFLNAHTEETIEVETTRSWIRKTLQLEYLKKIVSEITLIRDVRVREDFNVFISEDGKGVKVENLQLEFYVNGAWLSYSSLSDGTKRVFNLLADISSKNDYMVGKGIWGISNQEIGRVILIEEPELGIHPHQLYKLMRFIKEQSKTKQIIITTHSPEVLDILGKDDLNRIILADYDSEKGTQLRHLSEIEKKEATTFLETVAFLSDYWKHSTLEAR